MSKTLADQDQIFINQAQSIRSQHLLLQDYDRQMISAITERRNTIQATKLAELNVTEEVAGCSGKQLEDLRRRAQDEMANLRDYLRDFNRALKNDPPAFTSISLDGQLENLLVSLSAKNGPVAASSIGALASATFIPAIPVAEPQSGHVPASPYVPPTSSPCSSTLPAWPIFPPHPRTIFRRASLDGFEMSPKAKSLRNCHGKP